MKIKYFLIFPFLFTSLTAENTLQKAEAFRNEFKLHEAVKLLENYSEKNADSENLLALLYLDLNWLGKADNLYSRLCEKYPSYQCFLAYGSLKMKMSGYELAEEQYRNALKLQNTSAAHSNLAIALFYQRKFVQAREHHETALKINPGDRTAKINYAIFLFTQKQFEEAETIFRNILSGDSGSFYSHLFLGRIEYINKNYQNALNELNQGININSTFYDLYYHRAVVYYKLGNKSSALKDLNTAIRLEPLNSQAVELRNKINKEK